MSGLPDTARAIPGWSGYFVDEEARVWTTRRRKRARELRQFDRGTIRREPSPYLSVSLARQDGKKGGVNKFVHELVALAFIGPRPPGAEILHDPETGSKDNRPSSLRYDTPEQNSLERRLPRGADWYRARGMCPPDARGRDDDTTPNLTTFIDEEHPFAGLIDLHDHQENAA